jgi:hypothetical protein
MSKRSLPAELRDQIRKLREELDDHEKSFSLRWEADMRAIKIWQEKTGRTMVWPDHTDLLVWLMEQLDDAERARKTQKPLDETPKYK